LYAPLGARHPDHALLRRYASAMLGQTSVPLCLYADVPYATVLGWPHWVTGAAHDDRLDVDAEWAAWLPAVAELAHAGPARVVALGAGRSTRKLEAMRRYRTQFSALDAGGLRLLSNQAIHPFEVFWEVTSASPAHDRQGVRPAGHLAGRRARRHRSRTRSA
jgi:LmbE family N-acetylglucosaminyl deacetylase